MVSAASDARMLMVLWLARARHVTVVVVTRICLPAPTSVTPSTTANAPPAPRGGVCWFFKTGNCVRDNCRYLHVSDSAVERESNYVVGCGRKSKEPRSEPKP